MDVRCLSPAAKVKNLASREQAAIGAIAQACQGNFLPADCVDCEFTSASPSLFLRSLVLPALAWPKN
jgi:hypothetical protein